MKVVILGVPKKISSGVRTHVESLVHGLNEHNVETYTISSYPEGIYKFIVSLPQKLLEILNKDLAFKWRHYTRKFYVKNKLRRIISNENNVIINIQSVDWYKTVEKYINNKNITIVLTVHGIYSEQLKAKGYSNNTINEIKKIEIEAYSNIQKVITVSKFLEKYVKELSNRSDISMIPNGLIIKDIPKKQTKTNQNSIIKCVFIGSLLKYKGVHIAIEAIKILNDNNIDISLDIIGDGPEYINLNTIVKELGIGNNVKFLGLVPRSEINAKMIEYDVALIPSIPYGDLGEEAFPYACLEAMAAGLVVIASNIGGLPIMIKSGVNGYLVNHGNASEIVNVIMNNLHSIKESDDLGNNARLTIEHEYSSTSMAGKYIDLYSS